MSSELSPNIRYNGFVLPTCRECDDRVIRVNDDGICEDCKD